MPDKTSTDAVAYLNADHPAASEGAGYYEVRGDDEGNPEFGAKLESHPKDTAKSGKEKE